MINYLEGLADAKHSHCSGSKRADMAETARFHFSWSTAQEQKFDANLTYRPPKGQMGQKRPVSIEKRLFLGLQHNSRNSMQI